jgi:hypothetical protein
MSAADKINIALLVAAVVGIALTFWQVRKGARSQRAQFLKELYLTMTADVDIGAAYYQIEYGKFKYDQDFHDSEIERQVDRLLSFADLVAELYLQSAISKREMVFFQYRFRRICEDKEIQAYLTFLSSFYKQVGVGKNPYDSFQRVAMKFGARGLDANLRSR